MTGYVNRVLMLQTGQVLGEETKALLSHALVLESSCSAEVFLPGPGFCRGLCNIHSIPVCWAGSRRAPPEALPSSCHTLTSKDKTRQAFSIRVACNQLKKTKWRIKSAISKWSSESHVDATL